MKNPAQDRVWSFLVERSGPAVSATIERLSMEALGEALALRQGRADEAQARRAGVEAAHKDLSVALTNLQDQISAAHRGSQAGQTEAIVAGARAESLMVFGLLAFAFVAAAGLVLFGFDYRNGSRVDDASGLGPESSPLGARRTA